VSTPIEIGVRAFASKMFVSLVYSLIMVMEVTTVKSFTHGQEFKDIFSHFSLGCTPFYFPYFK